MIDNGNCVIYCNYSLNHSSFLDHTFVTDNIRQDIVCAEVHNTGVNLSDHMPVIYTFRWSLNHSAKQADKPKKVKQYSWRLDKSDLEYYIISVLITA